jgi:hypothetical protein
MSAARHDVASAVRARRPIMEGDRMLVAAMRSDNPLGGTPLVYDDAQETFLLGREPMLPSKILDLENRRQLDWANPVAREWSLEMAAMKLRKEQQVREAARAAEAVAAAAAAAAATAEAEARARAEELRALAASGGTLVFEPPLSARRPAGIRARAATFALPTATLAPDGAGRVVFAEPAADAEGAQGAEATAAAAPAAAPTTAPIAAMTGTWTVAAPVSPPFAAAMPAAPPTPADLHTSRKDRRRSRKEAEHRRERKGSGLRIAIYSLAAVAAAAALLIVQRGGL